MSQLEKDFRQFWQEYGPTGYELVEQYPFNPITWSDAHGYQERRWKFDAALPDHWIAIELEGIGGRHQFTAGFRADCEKYNTATSKGWSVLRFVSSDIKSRPIWVIEIIEDTIVEKEAWLSGIQNDRRACEVSGDIGDKQHTGVQAEGSGVLDESEAGQSGED